MDIPYIDRIVNNLYVNDLKETIKWVTELPANQVDKAGQPYIGHVRRVHLNLCRLFPDASLDEQFAALLHDTLEDCEVTAEDLRTRGYSEATIIMVEAVTKRKDQVISYQERIDRLAKSGNMGAIRVKIADLMDNSNPNRLTNLSLIQASSLSKRYMRALRTLWSVVRES